MLNFLCKPGDDNKSQALVLLWYGFDYGSFDFPSL